MLRPSCKVTIQKLRRGVPAQCRNVFIVACTGCGSVSYRAGDGASASKLRGRARAERRGGTAVGRMAAWRRAAPRQDGGAARWRGDGRRSGMARGWAAQRDDKGTGGAAGWQGGGGAAGRRWAARGTGRAQAWDGPPRLAVRVGDACASHWRRRFFAATEDAERPGTCASGC